MLYVVLGLVAVIVLGVLVFLGYRLWAKHRFKSIAKTLANERTDRAKTEAASEGEKDFADALERLDAIGRPDTGNGDLVERLRRYNREAGS